MFFFNFLFAGRRTVSNDIPTDPFMTLVVPSDHFTSGAGFATPNYCDVAKVTALVIVDADENRLQF